MDEVIAKADREVLAEVVKFAQKHDLKGSKGGWKDFLEAHDRKFGAGLSDPAKRSADVLVAFLQSFTKKDCKLFRKMIRRRSDHAAIELFAKQFPDQETSEQRLVRLTVEHPQYIQRYSFPSHDEVKLDKVINPNKAVADYKTDITGFTAKDLEGVTTSLDEVQKSLKKLLSHGAILVGHALHNDLKVLKIDHPRIIDTACIFKFKDLPTAYSPSLNNLCQSVLGYKIRREGEPHNCLIDAQAAMKLVHAKLEHGFDDPIVIAGKDVPESDLAKLLLHKIPVEIPCQELRSVFSMEYDMDIQADLRVRGQCYSTFAVFRDEGEADAAFRGIEGQETMESSGRLQKQVPTTLSTGQTFSFYIRKMRADGLLNGVEPPNKRLAVGDGNRDLKRQRMCLHECDHVKEVKKLKQELHDREEEIFNLQRILAGET